MNPLLIFVLCAGSVFNVRFLWAIHRELRIQKGTTNASKIDKEEKVCMTYCLSQPPSFSSDFRWLTYTHAIVSAKKD